GQLQRRLVVTGLAVAGMLLAPTEVVDRPAVLLDPRQPAVVGKRQLRGTEDSFVGTRAACPRGQRAHRDVQPGRLTQQSLHVAVAARAALDAVDGGRGRVAGQPPALPADRRAQGDLVAVAGLLPFDPAG